MNASSSTPDSPSADRIVQDFICLIKEIRHRLTATRLRPVLCLLVLLAACAPRNPPPSNESAPRLPTPTAVPPPASAAAGQIWLHPIDEMPLVFIPAGEFLMGSTSDDPAADETEFPAHTVRLSAYWIDQTEVTNRMYARCVLEGRCTPPALHYSLTRTDYYENLEYAEHPVVNVSWYQAVDYCTWAGRRLPTEAEWEKAARDQDGGIYPWGDSPPDCSLVMYGEPLPGQPTCGDDTLAAGSLPDGASPYGVLDLAGNVWEWTADRYAADWYAASPPNDPTGPTEGDTRVLRGGSFSDTAITIRAANRHHTAPENASYIVGFRCAISARP